MRITDGLYALPLEVEMGGMHLTLHPALIELDHGVALIDAGLPNTTEQLTERIAETGHTLEEVRVLVFTHQDGDHAGGGDWVRRQAEPTVLAHHLEAPPIAGESEPRGPGGERYPAVPVDVEIGQGTRLRSKAGTVEVVETPGHTPGHVSLFLRERGILLAADALTVNEGAISGPHPQMSEDMQTAMQSVAKLAEYPVRSILCYHGGYIEADSQALRALG